MALPENMTDEQMWALVADGDAEAREHAVLRFYPMVGRIAGKMCRSLPSYVDPDERIARLIEAPANYPITVFLDARGKPAFIHQGPYDSARALEADVDRYLAT